MSGNSTKPGEMPPECWMKGTFVNRLPSHVRRLLKSLAMIESLKVA